MKQSTQEIELEYKASDLYNIVLDLEKYPIYIPWCSNITILKISKNRIKANMIVNYKLFPSQKFTSNVFFDSKKLLIKTNYINGPLRDLKTEWEFLEIKKNTCRVLFSVRFKFKSFFYQKISELFFPLIEKKMMESFIKRAQQTLD